MAPSPIGVMVTKPELSCVILYKADNLAGTLALFKKDTSSNKSFLQPTNSVSDAQNTIKNFMFFIINYFKCD